MTQPALSVNPTLTGTLTQNPHVSQAIQDMGGYGKFTEPSTQPNFGNQFTGRTFDSYNMEWERTQVIQTVINLYDHFKSVILMRCLPAVMTDRLNFAVRAVGLVPQFMQPTPEYATTKEVVMREEFRMHTLERYGIHYSGTMDSLDTPRGQLEKTLKEEGIVQILRNQAEFRSLFSLTQTHTLANLNKMRFGDAGLDFFSVAHKEIDDFGLFSINPEEGLRSMAERAESFINRTSGKVPDTMLVPPGSSFLIRNSQQIKTFALTISGGVETRLTDNLTALGNIGKQQQVFEAASANTYLKWGGHDPTDSLKIITEYAVHEPSGMDSMNMYNFKPQNMDIRIFDFNLQEFVLIPFTKSLENAHLFDSKTGGYCDKLESWFQKYQNNPNVVNRHFFVAENTSGNPQLIQVWGQMKPEDVGDGFRFAAQSLLGSMFGRDMDALARFSRAIANGIRLRNLIMNENPTLEYMIELESFAYTKGSIPPWKNQSYGSNYNFAKQTSLGSTKLPKRDPNMLYPVGFHGWNGICQIAYSEDTWGIKNEAKEFVNAVTGLANHIKKSIPSSFYLNPKSAPWFIHNPKDDSTYALISTLWDWDDCYAVTSGSSGLNPFPFRSLLGHITSVKWDNFTNPNKESIGNVIYTYLQNCTNDQQQKEMARKMVSYATTSLESSSGKKVLDLLLKGEPKSFITHAEKYPLVEENDISPSSTSIVPLIIPLAASESIDAFLEENPPNPPNPLILPPNPSAPTPTAPPPPSLSFSWKRVQYKGLSVVDSSAPARFESSFIDMDADNFGQKSRSKFARIGDYFGGNASQGRQSGHAEKSGHSDCMKWESFLRNKNHVDTFTEYAERMTACAIMATENTKQAWDTYLRCGFPLIKTIDWRPMIGIKTGCLISMVAGEDTGFTAYMEPKVTYGADPENQTYSGTLTIRTAPIIVKPENIFQSHDFFLRGYVGGWGTGFITTREDLTEMRNGTGHKSFGVLSTAVPWNWKPINNALSICGEFRAPNEYRNIPQGDTYPTASYYDEIYDFSGMCQSPHIGMFPSHLNGLMTGYAGRSYHLKWTEKTGGTTGNFTEEVMGTGHLKDVTYIDNIGVITGTRSAIPRSERKLPHY